MLLAEENVVLAGKGLSRWLSIIEARDKVEEEKRENFHCQVLKSPRSLSRMTGGGFRGAIKIGKNKLKIN